MTKRPLALSLMSAAATTIAALALLLLSPVRDTGAATQPPTASSTRLPYVIVLPAVVPKLAHASVAGYVHQANCKAALEGANGDNDIQAWINTHTPTGVYAWSWSTGYQRQDNTHFVQFIDLYAGSPMRLWGNIGGYCLGDDSNIVDKADGAPAGW